MNTKISLIPFIIIKRALVKMVPFRPDSISLIIFLCKYDNEEKSGNDLQTIPILFGMN